MSKNQQLVHLWPKVVPTLDDAGNPVEVIVREGQVYVFQYDVMTRAGYDHRKGELLIVFESTRAAPHGEISQSCVNWLCATKHSVSVWATLEQCIARGMLALRDSRGY